MNTALLHSRDRYPYFQRHTYYASYQELVYENPISWNPRLVTGYCAIVFGFPPRTRFESTNGWARVTSYVGRI